MNRPQRLPLAIGLCALHVLAGCASDTSNDALSPPGQTSPSTTSAGGAGAGASQGLSDGAGTGAQPADTPGGGASPTSPAGTTGGPANDVAKEVDGGGLATTNPGDDPNTKGNDAPGHVSCGDAVADCDMTAGSNCCVSALMTTDCRQGECGFGDTSTACDGPEDCADGEVCCTHVNVPVGVTSSCEPANPVANGSRCQGGSTIGDFELCHTDDDCDPTALCDMEGDGTFPWWAFCGEP